MNIVNCVHKYQQEKYYEKKKMRKRGLALAGNCVSRGKK